LVFWANGNQKISVKKPEKIPGKKAENSTGTFPI
jgi:hypothetical protein